MISYHKSFWKTFEIKKDHVTKNFYVIVLQFSHQFWNVKNVQDLMESGTKEWKGYAKWYHITLLILLPVTQVMITWIWTFIGLLDIYMKMRSNWNKYTFSNRHRNLNNFTVIRYRNSMLHLLNLKKRFLNFYHKMKLMVTINYQILNINQCVQVCM